MTDTTPADVLLALIRLAGSDGVSAAQIRIGVRLIKDTDTVLEGLERSGLARSEPQLLRFAGKRYFATERAT